MSHCLHQRHRLPLQRHGASVKGVTRQLSTSSVLPASSTNRASTKRGLRRQQSFNNPALVSSRVCPLTSSSPGALPLKPAATWTPRCPIAAAAGATAVPDLGSSSDASSSSSTPAGRAVVVGGGPAGLAAAVGLARQAGFAVDVFDSRPHPTSDSKAANHTLLVAFGARGLQALCDLDISLTATPQRNTASTSGSSSATTTISTGPDGTFSTGSTGGLSGPQAVSGPQAASPPGLIMLQGMVLMGPDGRKRVERYGAGSGRAEGRQQLKAPAGIAVLDSYTLTTSLLAEAGCSTGEAPSAAATTAPSLSRPATSEPPGLLSSQPPSAAGTAVRPQPGPTPLRSSGAAAAASAEDAQEAAMPPVVPAPGTTAGKTTDVTDKGQAVLIGQTAAGGQAAVGGQTASGAGGEAGGAVRGSVRCHYSSELMLIDTANKQATFMGAGGEAVVVPYDILVGAEQAGGAGLVATALAELHQRSHAHKHPTHPHTSRWVANPQPAGGKGDQHYPIYSSPAAAAASATAPTAAAAAASTHAAAKAAAAAEPEHAGTRPASAGGGLIELEFKAWHDMPHQAELKALLPAGCGDDLRYSLDDVGQPRHQAPGQGWLLVWTGAGASSHSRTFSSTSGGAGSAAVAVIPGGPSCSLMAWPSRGGGSWSGAVFTAPQVFESLRSQADYEGLLRGLRVPAGDSARDSGLPGLWIKGIASQLRSAGAERVGRVPAPWLLPPSHLSAPSAGLLLLGPAAALAPSPQLLCPDVPAALEDAAQLAAAVGAAVGGGSAGGAGLQQKVEQGLRQYDSQRQPQVAALQRLEAQLSYLRHPFSPAAPAALASIPPATLAWLSGLVGKPHSGLALQWKCLVGLLPLVAGLSRVLKGLGLSASSASKAQQQQQQKGSAGGSVGSNVAAGAAGGAAIGLGDVLHAAQPSGASLLAFLHSTAMPFTALWRLLHLAPLLAAALWSVGVWVVVQAVRWAVLAFRVWGISQAAA